MFFENSSERAETTLMRRRAASTAPDRRKEILDAAGIADDGSILERLGNTHEQLGEIAVVRGNTSMAIDQLQRSREYLIEAGAEKWDAEHHTRLQTRIQELKKQ